MGKRDIILTRCAPVAVAVTVAVVDALFTTVVVLEIGQIVADGG